MAHYADIALAVLLEPPNPVRTQMDEEKLADLAANIRLVGLINPLSVIPARPEDVAAHAAQWNGTPEAQRPPVPEYRIVAGHRRFLACRRAGLRLVGCMVFDSEAEAEEAIQIAENALRENVTPAEEGWKIAEYVEKHKPLEDDLPRIFGQSLSWIYDRLAFVQGAPDVVEANSKRLINYAVAKELMKCEDTAHRKYLLDCAIEGGATARLVMGWVAAWRASRCGPRAEIPAESVTINAVALPTAPAGCVFCGSREDMGNMVSVAIHKHEIQPLIGVLKQLGLRGE